MSSGFVTNSPVNGLTIPNIPQEFRTTKTQLKTIFEKEHGELNTTKEGAHLMGSGLCYIGTDFPVYRPDAETAFTAEDLGRMLFRTDLGKFYILTALTPTWTDVTAAVLAAANTFVGITTFSLNPVFTKGIVAYNTFLTGRNSTDAANANLIKVMAGNFAQLADGAQLEAATLVADPDRTISDKAYVDANTVMVPTVADGVDGTTESVTLPNGLIIKRGVVARTTAGTEVVAYDTAFTAGCVPSVNVTMETSELDNIYSPTLVGSSNTGFSVIIADTENDLTKIHWTAIGY